MQQGGGIGHDFSTLRPKGAPVASIGADASGPVSFMEVWDAMCRTIMSAGARRGAMMATLRCDHPDIEAFVDAKADPAELRNFNLSVLVTDDFLGAVRRRPRLGPEVRRQGLPHAPGARTVGAHHARDLRFRRAGRRVHRSRQRRATTSTTAKRSTPRIPAASSRCRRSAPACSGSINLARLIEKPFTGDAASRRRQARRAREGRPSASSTTSSTSRITRCRAAAPGGHGQAAHRPRRHRASPTR